VSTTQSALTIVILNWNGLADTLACLSSLSKVAHSSYHIDTLVIDNHSQDDPTPAIAAQFPAVRLVRATRNLGFAGGCNLGARMALEAGADYVLLLNNDTVVDAAFLWPLLAYAEAHPRAGLIAPLICEADRPEVVQSRGGEVVLALGHAFHRDTGRLRAKVAAAPAHVGFVSGCCVLIPAQTLRATGGFAERYFAYFEDVDLSLRVRRLGFETVCIPTSVIWHKESASTRRGLREGTTSPLKHYLMLRNRIATVRRNGRWWEQIGFFSCVLPALTAFYIAAFTARQRWRKLVWFMLGAVHGLQGRFENGLLAHAVDRAP
jgi:GT2 family glycosyltransferase